MPSTASAPVPPHSADATIEVAPGQSVAVRLVVEREREIEAFVPSEYWKIAGVFSTESEGGNCKALAEGLGEGLGEGFWDGLCDGSSLAAVLGLVED